MFKSIVENEWNPNAVLAKSDKTRLVVLPDGSSAVIESWNGKEWVRNSCATITDMMNDKGLGCPCDECWKSN